MTDDLKALRELLADFVEELTNGGTELPLYMTSVSVNGSAVFVRYRDDAGGNCVCDYLAQHFEGGGLVLPINLMCIDKKGGAHYAVITKDGRRLLH